uniref:Putative ovule protein n=1 Tax=Solanum chacoense TaxID=4108 RepID=A0A0V0IXA0_SOLCH
MLRIIFILARSNISGLHINWTKIYLYPVGVIPLHSLARIIGGKVGVLPTEYLRMPLGAKSKCEKKLSIWKSNYLSLGVN